MNVWRVEYRISDNRVIRVFVPITGQSYTPAPGAAFEDVPRSTYVGAGFTRIPAGEGEQFPTYTPPAPDEEPPEGMTAQERLAQAEAKLAEVQTEINAAKAILG